MAQNYIPIVLAFTPNYIVPAATCMLSILRHSDFQDHFHMICLTNGVLSEDTRRALESLDQNRLIFTFMNLEEKLNDVRVNERYTVAASYRLLLPELLSEFNKVIYVDCDVIVRNNLAELYRSTDLTDSYLAGVYEATLDHQRAHMNAIGCEPGKYINSGFLLMNLELLRRDEMTSEFISALGQENLEFPDQDVINQLCKGKISGLPPYYNSIRTFFLPQYKPAFLSYYSNQDWEAVQKHGNIHYTGEKPWEAFTIEFATWWKYYELLPTSIKKLWEPDAQMRKLYKIYKTRLGKTLINKGQHIYRRVKYGVK